MGLTPFPSRKGKSMESGVKRSQRDYTLAFKLSVVDQVEKGESHLQTGAGALRHPGSLDRAGVAAQARPAKLGRCGIITATDTHADEKIFLCTCVADPRAEDQSP